MIAGQYVDGAKVERAKQFRTEMTAEEALLWRHLRRNQLDGLHFRRQQVIAGFIVDFYCHAAALVVEVDGRIHETQRSYDDARDNILRARDLRVLRLPAEEVRANIQAVVHTIAAAAREQLT